MHGIANLKLGLPEQMTILLRGQQSGDLPNLDRRRSLEIVFDSFGFRFLPGFFTGAFLFSALGRGFALFFHFRRLAPVFDGGVLEHLDGAGHLADLVAPALRRNRPRAAVVLPEFIAK